MKAPVSWLRELVALPEVSTAELAAAFTAAGLNVERVEKAGPDFSGPVVVGRVLGFVPEEQKNGKTIRWCRVDVGSEHNQPPTADQSLTGFDAPGRSVVCGADNFAAGDLVVVSLPGSVLAGGFQIAARKTYGHVSDGMICAPDELGTGHDHSGIIVLPDVLGSRVLKPGDPADSVLGDPDEVLDIDVTPDIGYAMSMRGLAREAAQAFGVDFTDPYRATVPQPQADGHPVVLESESCPLFVARTVTDVDPSQPSPQWMVERLERAGMRSISLIVDVTNYVMLESGQPLHAYDAALLSGPIVVRRASEGEHLVTLDDVARVLDPDDLVIADDSGAIGLAGVMGGATTEVTEATQTVVIEAAHFVARTVSRGMRRHKLPSEASLRFERGVDRALPWAAADRAVELLVELAGGRESGATVAGGVSPMPAQRIPADLPSRVLGFEVPGAKVTEVLVSSGVEVATDGDQLDLIPPTWRPDLADPFDYVEEVGRKLGFEAVPSVVPQAPAGTGFTRVQTLRRSVARAVAAGGFVELLTLPFIGEDDLSRLGLDADDPRGAAVRLANPLADTQPYLRTTLLPGLFAAVTRNTSRSTTDLSVFETGSVFRSVSDQVAPRPDVSVRPSEDEIAALNQALPEQPNLMAAVVCGDWTPKGWQGPAAPADWTRVVAFAEIAGEAVGLRLTRVSAQRAPWHPGRCAALIAGDQVIGHAGELHPRTIDAFGLPERTSAVEFDLDALIEAGPRSGHIKALSSFPVAKEDVALIVDARVSSAEVRDALIEGAGELLEAVSLFDVYTGPQVGEAKKSLAYSMKFRGERTLTDAEAAQARDAAVALATERFGAVLRG